MKFNDALSRVAWQDFEVLIANHYRDQGYDVLHCGDGRFGVRNSSEVDLRMISQGKLPRLGRRTWGLPIFLAALTFLGLVVLYGATMARSRLEHPLPPQVDPATLPR